MNTRTTPGVLLMASTLVLGSLFVIPQAHGAGPNASTEPSATPPSPLLVPRISNASSLASVSVVSTKPAGVQVRQINATVDGKQVSVQAVHLQGIQAIEAADLPEPARQWLLAHAKTLPPGELPIYVVNKQEAVEFSRNHAAPSKPAGGGGSHHGGVAGAVRHAGERASKAATHAEKETERQIDGLEHHATEEWRHLYREAAKDFNVAGELVERCFEDNAIESRWIPIKYQRALEMTVPLAGEAVVKISVPVQLDLRAKAGAFVVPCLRFMNRPRNVALQGFISIGAGVVVDFKKDVKLAKATYSFKPAVVHVLGPTVVMAGPVPVEIDAVLELVPKLNIGAEVLRGARFSAEVLGDATLDMECDGHGCHPTRGASPPAAAHPPRPGDGPMFTGTLRATVQPAIEGQLELQAYGGLLTASVEPELYLIGNLDSAGCSERSGNGAKTQAGANGVAVLGTAGLDIQFEVKSQIEIPEAGIHNKLARANVAHAHIWGPTKVVEKKYACP